MSGSVRFCDCAPAPFSPWSLRFAGVTVMRFDPSDRIVACTCADAPLPTATIAMTDATPMITPSIVRAERSLLTMIDWSAERKESNSFIVAPSPEPSRAAGNSSRRNLAT